MRRLDDAERLGYGICREELKMAESTHRLSLQNIADAATTIDPVFLHSPQFLCEAMSAQLGCRLTLKVETINPIRCFKGRGADYFLAQRVQRGETGPLVC